MPLYFLFSQQPYWQSSPTSYENSPLRGTVPSTKTSNRRDIHDTADRGGKYPTNIFYYHMMNTTSFVMIVTCYIKSIALATKIPRKGLKVFPEYPVCLKKKTWKIPNFSKNILILKTLGDLWWKRGAHRNDARNARLRVNRWQIQFNSIQFYSHSLSVGAFWEWASKR